MKISELLEDLNKGINFFFLIFHFCIMLLSEILGLEISIFIPNTFIFAHRKRYCEQGKSRKVLWRVQESFVESSIG